MRCHNERLRKQRAHKSLWVASRRSNLLGRASKQQLRNRRRRKLLQQIWRQKHLHHFRLLPFHSSPTTGHTSISSPTTLSRTQHHRRQRRREVLVLQFTFRDSKIWKQLRDWLWLKMGNGDAHDLTSTQGQNKPQKAVQHKQTIHKHKLSRWHRLCIKNTPICKNVTNSKVQPNWFNIPYKDQRWYWTPRDIPKKDTLGDLMWLKNIHFKCHGFQAQFDVQITTVGNVKVDVKPTNDPLLYIRWE